MSYIVKRRNRVFEVKKIEYPFKGYKFKSKNENIKELTIVDGKLVKKVVNKKINNMFIRLLMIVNDAYNSDDNDSGTAIALDEILMVKNSIKNKYAKYLEKEEEEIYLKKLAYLEEELKYKRYYTQSVVEEKSGRSR